MVVNNSEALTSVDTQESDEINKKETIKQLGYDPFEDYSEQDKRFLYNTLLPFLDDATLEDSFKLPIVIEIVKSLNESLIKLEPQQII